MKKFRPNSWSAQARRIGKYYGQLVVEAANNNKWALGYYMMILRTHQFAPLTLREQRELTTMLRYVRQHLTKAQWAHEIEQLHKEAPFNY